MRTSHLPVFMVDGEPYVSAGDAVRTVLEATNVLTASGAYQAVNRGARTGRVRTVQASRRVRWYHEHDVTQLADQLRGT